MVSRRYIYKNSYQWSSALAYVVGLITTDGCLSKDRRHIDFTSKDTELVSLYRDIIKPKSKIGTKSNGRGQLAHRVQISDVSFYDFLEDIGLRPN